MCLCQFLQQICESHFGQDSTFLFDMSVMCHSTVHFLSEQSTFHMSYTMKSVNRCLFSTDCPVLLFETVLFAFSVTTI
jgi:hypothetical protein